MNHGGTSHYDKMTFHDQAEHIIRFADALEIEKFAIVGQSMGARAGMMAASTYPDRVLGIMPLDAPAVSFKNFPGYADR